MPQGVTTSPHSFPLWTHAPIAGHSVESFNCYQDMRCGSGLTHTDSWSACP